MRNISNASKMTAKMWDREFTAAERWHTVAKKFGIGFVFYLPIDQPLTNTW